MTTEAFIVTQVGLYGATSAALAGISLVLSTFKVGSAYGYTPVKTDTSLHGTVLYTDNITSVSTGSDGSLLVNCTMAVTAGPFDFGEVGIYTSTGDLFALLALPALEHKYTSLGSTVASTFTFRAYLRLGQVGGIIEISTGGGGGTSNFVYTLMSGQPPALWGSSNGGVDSYVWNPSNFNVSTAKNVENSGSVHYNGTDHTWHAADGTTHLADLSSGGVLTVANVAITSDMDYKTAVTKVDEAEALHIMTGLDGLTYELKEFPGQRHPGWSAQQLETLFPVGVTKNTDGKRAVSYAQTLAAITPPTIRALLRRIEDLESDLGSAKNDIIRLEREVL